MDFAALAAFTIHDVKNRLHGLAAQAVAAGQPAMLHGALEAAATLTRLLAWYKAEKGSLGIDMDARVPEDLLHELATEIRAQTALTVRIETAAAPTLWYYDEALVRMVLLNAIYNALRHARQAIRLSAVDAGEWLEFRVEDDGAGFPAALLAEAPGEQPLSREGTGLGLHLARHVAALHANAGLHGTIQLKNDPGAVFCLRLPR